MKIFWTLVCLTFGLITTAQVDTTSKRQPLGAYGLDIKNIKVSGSFVLPSDTPKLRIADTGATAVVNGRQYIWTRDKIWKASEGSSSGSGSGTVSNLTATNGTGQTWTITNATTTPNIALTLSKDAVGLSSVDNTADVDKPLSSAATTALAGKAETIHSHIESDITGLAASLAGKANTSHTHIEGDITGLAASLSGKASTVHSHIISDVTSLQTTIDAKVADALTNGTTTVAPSQNVVYDVIASNQYARPPSQKIFQLLGSNVLYETLGQSQANISVSAALADGTARFIAVNITEQSTITGVKWWQSVTGNYTSDNYNGIALYSYNSGTITLVASSADDGNIWKGTLSTIQSKAFSSPYLASPGIYFIGYLYNTSSQTTAPSIGAYTTLVNAGITSESLSNSAKITSQLAGQTGFPSSQAMSGLTANVFQLYGGLY